MTLRNRHEAVLTDILLKHDPKNLKFGAFFSSLVCDHSLWVRSHQQFVFFATNQCVNFAMKTNLFPVDVNTCQDSFTASAVSNNTGDVKRNLSRGGQ